MSFDLDPRIAVETVPLWADSQRLILLRDESRWPWCVVMPITTQIEFHSMDDAAASALIKAVRATAAAISRLPQVGKINLASFGNVVAQQHWHVIGRNQTDPLWPDPVIGQPRVASAAPLLQQRAEWLQRSLCAELGRSEPGAIPHYGWPTPD